MERIDQHKQKQFNREDFTEVSNSLSRAVKADPADRITVEIGDTKQPDFYPQVKINRWGDSEDTNEVNFSIRRDNGARSFVERDGKIVAESRDENVVIYELEPDEQNEDGGLEIEIELPRQPKTNVFEFTLQTKGLNFYYQPELTEEEKAEGDSQPENVIGSYAAYHATKRNNRVGGKHYKTGKAFHIYRPKAIDADGAEVWCELNIDEQAGVLTVTVPQQWLNRASYPVRVDPTFGYTSLGGSSTVMSAPSGSPGGYVHTLSYLTLDESGVLITGISSAASTNNSANGDNRKLIVLDIGRKLEAISDQESYPVDVGFGNIPSFVHHTVDEANSLTLNAGQKYLGYISDVGFGSRFAHDNDFDLPFADTANQITSSYTPSLGHVYTLGSTGGGRRRVYSIYATYEAAASDDPITKVKVSGTFVPVAPKVKLSGTFVEKTSKVKVGGTFV